MSMTEKLADYFSKKAEAQKAQPKSKLRQDAENAMASTKSVVVNGAKAVGSAVVIALDQSPMDGIRGLGTLASKVTKPLVEKKKAKLQAEKAEQVKQATRIMLSELSREDLEALLEIKLAKQQVVEERIIAAQEA